MTRQSACAGAALFALALAGCGDDAGTGGGGGGNTTKASSSGTGDAPNCGPVEESFVDPACGACAEMSCCDEIAACDATPCADLDACLAASCSSQCGIITEGICGTEYTTTILACDMCVEGACCPEVDACVANAACAGCLDDPTAMGCDTNMLLGDVEACFMTSCADQCDG
jgi:hypothetical protein